MDFIKKLFGKYYRRKECKYHFGENDIYIENIRLNAIHEFLQKTSKGWEIVFKTETGVYKQILKNLELDFYMDINKDIYILRLQDKPENKIIFVNRETISDKIIPMTYIIIMKKLSENIKEELTIIIKKLKKMKFPEYYEEIMYEIEEWK